MKIYIIFISIISLLTGTVYYLYEETKNLSSQINTLSIKNEGLEIWGEGLKVNINSIKKVNKQLAIVNTDMKVRMEIFNKHDMNKIANKKPKMLERRVNNANNKVFNNIACLSDPTRVCDEGNSKN